MKANKQTLIRRRASVKASLTVQENVLSQFEVRSAEDHEQLSFRFDQIRLLNWKFEDFQSELELIKSDSDLDPLKRGNFDRKFFRSWHIVRFCWEIVSSILTNPLESNLILLYPIGMIIISPKYQLSCLRSNCLCSWRCDSMEIF